MPLGVEEAAKSMALSYQATTPGDAYSTCLGKVTPNSPQRFPGSGFSAVNGDWLEILGQQSR